MNKRFAVKDTDVGVIVYVQIYGKILYASYAYRQFVYFYFLFFMINCISINKNKKNFLFV